MRRFLFSYFLIGCVLFTVAGCVAVNKALGNYEACKGDPVCMEEMQKVKDSSYVVSKVATQSLPVPSVAEMLALGISNLCAFGFGVVKGRKKG